MKYIKTNSKKFNIFIKYPKVIIIIIINDVIKMTGCYTYLPYP